MTRSRFFLLLILAFVVALYFEDSRRAMLDFASPAAQPALRWMTNQELKQIVDDLETHRATRGSLPLARGEFDRWLRDRYRDDRYWQDAWGTPYQLRAQGNRFQVISAGSDREFGTDDDLIAEGTR
jgi:hypothetical protein